MFFFCKLGCLFFKVVVPECINRIYAFDDERKLFKSLNIVLFCYQNRHLFCLLFFSVLWELFAKDLQIHPG